MGKGKRMSFEAWLAFTAAAVVLLVIPGPTILLVLSYSLNQGRRAGLAAVAGSALGDFTAMTASVLGLGTLLATSATLFTALKWLGAGYLIWLGWKMWRTAGAAGAAEAVTAPAATLRPGRIMLHAYAVTALNPKSLVFFVAFLPQFLDPARPFLTQILIMEATFLVLAGLNAASYALLASAARQGVRRPGALRLVNRAGGTLLIGAGLLAAGWRRATN